ncbi:MAG: hypothetical protein LBS21_09160 [Clostridiales bacterium]|jgi:tetratricopeptide (TPR) repeat protein|nr:hypothetical protein [Clostridiales bacterium]
MKNKKFAIFALSAVIIAIAYFAISTINRNGIYENAVNLAAKGGDNYEAAIAEFEKIPNHKDAGVRINLFKTQNIPYRDAKELQNEGQYEQAALIYEELGGYSDSAELAQESRKAAEYEKAEEFFTNGDYSSAEEIFKQLAEQNFSNSAQRAEEMPKYASYDDAASLLADGNNADAYELFYDLGDFLDSAEQKNAADEALWQEVINSDSKAELARYITLPGSQKHNNDEIEAQQTRLTRIEAALEFKRIMPETLPENINVKPINTFIGKWNNYTDAEIADMVSKAKALQNEILADSKYSAPILSDPDNATDEMIDSFLQDFGAHADTERVKALREADFFELLNAGKITATVTGGGIENSTVSITSNVKHEVNTVIPLGTYFASGSVQNMVVRSEKPVYLRASGSATVTVPSACMNISRSIPYSDDSLSVRKLTNARLERVIRECSERGASYEVTQAATWIVTDNPSEYDLLHTLVYTYSNGIRSQAIDEDDLAKARQIVKDAG